MIEIPVRLGSGSEVGGREEDSGSYLSSSSLSNCSLPELEPSTLEVLDSFLEEKIEEQARFDQMAARLTALGLSRMGRGSCSESEEEEEVDQEEEEEEYHNSTDEGKTPSNRSSCSSSSSSYGQDLAETDESDSSSHSSSDSSFQAKSCREDEKVVVKGKSLDLGEKQFVRMSPDEFRAGFGESWQLSQFWYSTTFANRLSRCIREELESLRREEGIPNPKLGFLSCPTGYVSYLHLYPDSFRNVHLFEYDTRFSLLSGTNFTRYDLNRPLDFNDSQRFRGSFDLIVVDPPFLNEVTNRSMGETVKFLLKQGTPTQTTNRGKVILITGRSISEFACSVGVYDDLKPLTPFPLHVQHASGLANDFAIWGNWQGVDRFR